jgi:hypothetical protein
MAYTIECCWGKPLSLSTACSEWSECVLRLLAASRNSSKELKE